MRVGNMVCITQANQAKHLDHIDGQESESIAKPASWVAYRRSII